MVGSGLWMRVREGKERRRREEGGCLVCLELELESWEKGMGVVVVLIWWLECSEMECGRGVVGWLVLNYRGSLGGLVGRDLGMLSIQLLGRRLLVLLVSSLGDFQDEVGE